MTKAASSLPSEDMATIRMAGNSLAGKWKLTKLWLNGCKVILTG